MKPWMMAVMSGVPELVSRTFTSNQAVTIPLGVSRLETVAGKGQDGTPASRGSRTVYYLVVLATRFSNRRDGGVDVGETAEVSQSETTASAPVPSPATQGPFATPNDPVYSSFSIQYQYAKEARTVSTDIPATTGANATGFGKTFPGGTGVPAVPAPYESVVVTPGQSYALTIPSGGYITITYYQ